MIKEKELSYLRQVRFQNGSGVTNENLGDLLLAKTREFAVSAATSVQELKIGGTFNSKIIPCLTLYHPQHPKDYNYYVFKITRMGTYAMVDIFLGGNSPNAAATFAKENLFNFSSLTAEGKGQVVGSIINATVHGTLFGGKNKREEESNWYTIMNDVIEDVLDD